MNVAISRFSTRSSYTKVAVSLVAAAIVSLAFYAVRIAHGQTAFPINSRVQTTAALKVRLNPGGAVLGVQPLGAQGTVIGGPVKKGSYTWIQVNFDTSYDGWVASAYLKLIVPPPPPAFDFSLLSNTTRITLYQGSSGANTIFATLISGTSQPVSFSAVGLPAGAFASFVSSTCAPTCATQLTITATTSTPAGVSTTTVVGVGGSLTRTTSFTLTVLINTSSTPQPPPPAPSSTASSTAFLPSEIEARTQALAGILVTLQAILVQLAGFLAN